MDESGLDFVWLDQRYNAQVHARPKTAWNAIIWHIYSSDQHATPRTIIDSVLTRLSQNRANIDQIIDSIIQLDHPWLMDNLIDRFAICFMRRHQKILQPKNWKRLWLADDYIGAIISIFCNIWKSGFRLVTSGKNLN